MVFDCNQTPRCHPPLNPEKDHLNFNCELKKTKAKTSGNKFFGKNSSENNCASLLKNIIFIPS